MAKRTAVKRYDLSTIVMIGVLFLWPALRPRTSRNMSRNMRSTTTRLLMTRSCTYTVVRTIQHPPSYDLRLENCVDEVSHWMSANRLKLNADKTEVLWAGSRYGSAPLGSARPSLRLGNEVIAATDHVRVLGAVSYTHLTLPTILRV